MITDFLKLPINKDSLKTTLDVIKAFKKCESREEWLAIPFSAWAKLEQLEEFLEHLVNNEPLRKDTLEYIQSQNKEEFIHNDSMSKLNETIDKINSIVRSEDF